MKKLRVSKKEGREPKTEKKKQTPERNRDNAR